MNKAPNFIGYLLVLLFSCNSSTEIPTPIYSLGECQVQHVKLDFEEESYALNNMPFEPFNQKIVGWIPAEDDPTFYLISYHMRFCNTLNLNLEEYSFQLEEIGNPDGYWYEVTTTEELFSEILNGKIVEATFEKWAEEEPSPVLVGPVYN